MKALALLVGVVLLVAGGYWAWRVYGVEPVSAPSIVLEENGLGIVAFGASPDEALAALGVQLGAPTYDSGWISSFSPYGTCPGQEIRVLEWNRLRVFFGDTTFGTQKFFQWTYAAYEGEPAWPELATREGVTLGSTAEALVAAYPNATLEQTVEEGLKLFMVAPVGEAGDSLGGFLNNGAVSWMVGGIPCGD